MVNIKNIIHSQSAPDNTEVGWLTIEEGKPKLKFNINGTWTEVSSISEDTGESTGFISPYAKILSGIDGSTWLATIRPDTDLNDDDAVIDMHLTRINAEERLMGIYLDSNATVELFKSLNEDSLRAYDDAITNDQFSISAIRELQNYKVTDAQTTTNEVVVLPGIHILCSSTASSLELNIKRPEGDYETYNVTGLVSYIQLPQTVTSITFTGPVKVFAESSPITLEGDGNRLVKIVYFKSPGGSWGAMATVEGTNFKSNQ